MDESRRSRQDFPAPPPQGPLAPGLDGALHGSLLQAARDPHDVATLAFAGVMAMAGTRKPPYDALVAGLSRADIADLVAVHFPSDRSASWATRATEDATVASVREDEFDDLVVLLDEHATVPCRESRWLARALATGCMGDNHLWQDMGLPDRRTLSRLIQQRFTALFVRNVGNMRWKKFFYRQLCERAAVPICKSPSCAICVDVDECFPRDASHPRERLTFGGAHGEH